MQNRYNITSATNYSPSRLEVSGAFRKWFYPLASELLFIKNIYHVYVVERPCVTEVTRSRVPNPLLTLHSYGTTYKPEKYKKLVIENNS